MCDLRVQLAFWRQAAEQAIEGMLTQEDVSVALREKLLEACSIGVSIPPDYVRLYELRTEVILENGEDDA